MDSAVAAYLLKEEGYRVVGAFIKGWEPDFLPCTGVEDRLAAMQVAAHLQIPFVSYDLSEEYKKSVVDYFIAEYKVGRTPNPDVMCNRTIKFGAFWERVRADGADFIATGHYARNPQGDALGISDDKEKDQTYFLWTLTKDDLAHTLFPIGKYKKREVRKIAEKIKLPNAARRDSQGLCFLGHVDMHAFLKRYLPTTVGTIYDTDGAKVGEHDGAWFYTLGQHVPVSGDKRLYVVSKDVDRNELVVAETPNSERGRISFTLTNVSWVSGTAPTGKVLVQYRYHGPLVPASVADSERDRISLSLAEPVLAAPGQSLVVYSANGKLCLGGGVIV